MIEFVRCHPQHLWLFEPQPWQAFDHKAMQAPSVAAFIAGTVAVSGFAGGRCMGCAGVFDLGGGRAQVWALLSKDAGPFMLPISRKVRRVLSAYPATRFEASVAYGFEEGRRWMKLLGFAMDVERVTRAELPPGYDLALYSRRGKV